MQISLQSYINAISSSLTNYRVAVQTEMAVGVLVLMQGENDSKNNLLEIYEQAGYDCKSIKGRHYKTVNRRINAAVSLLNKIGQENLKKMVSHKKEMNAINGVAKKLSELNLDSIDDVLKYCGKSRKQAKTKSAPRRRWTDEERKNAKRIDTDHIHLVVPPEVPAKELREFALEVLALANNLESTNERPIPSSDRLPGRKHASNTAPSHH